MFGLNLFLKKVESLLLKLVVVQFLFLLVSQILLYKKELSPFLSKTIYSEGVFFEYVLSTMEILDHLP